MTKKNKKALSPKQRDDLLEVLQARFEKNIIQPKANFNWTDILAKLKAHPEKLWSLRWESKF